MRVLAERHGTVVSRDELMDAVWGTRFVAEGTLTTRIRAARRALGDSGEAQRLIRTVRGRGYEFLATASEIGSPPTASTPTGDLGFGRSAGGVRLAFEAIGAGPPLIKAANWMTHLGHDWRRSWTPWQPPASPSWASRRAPPWRSPTPCGTPSAWSGSCW